MANQYLLHGKLTAKAGQRNELADILLKASELVSTAKGCKAIRQQKTAWCFLQKLASEANKCTIEYHYCCMKMKKTWEKQTDLQKVH